MPVPWLLDSCPDQLLPEVNVWFKILWSKYDHERPDYKVYVKRMEDRKKADIKEQIEMTKEFERIEVEKIKEEAKKMKKIEWVDPK